MKIITKSGTEIEIEIAGTQERPAIVMKTQTIKGRSIGGVCTIAASQKRTKPGVPAEADSLYVESAKGFIQMDLAPIRAAIAALPHFVYMARKVSETVNSDGYEIELKTWKIEGSRTTKNGYYLSDDQLGDFLDRKGIAEIETAKAVEMWSVEHETPEKLAARKTANERGNRIAQHFADMEEMESGKPLAEERDPTPYHPREGE